MNIKPVLNRWQFILDVGRDWQRCERGWRSFSFGILRLHRLPPPGTMFAPNQYHGFLIRFTFWIPIDTY